MSISKNDFRTLGLDDDFFNQLDNIGAFQDDNVIAEIKKRLAEAKKPAAKIAQAEDFINSNYDIRLDIISNSIEARNIALEINESGQVVRTPLSLIHI